MKYFSLLLCALIGMLTLRAQNVHIPDSAFKATVLANVDINTNGDTAIQVSEAQAYTGQIWLYDKGVYSPTGLEAFVNLNNLNCDKNHLTAVDISALTALVSLSCEENPLTTISIANHPSLKSLYAGKCSLTSVNVTGATQLETLKISDNPLPSLDLTNTPALVQLFSNNCYSLTALDLSGHTQLTTSFSGFSGLTSVNVTGCTALSNLQLQFCPIVAVTGLGDCLALTSLLMGSKMTALDFSAHTQLQTLNVNNSPNLTSLNVKNGSNTNLGVVAMNCPKLGCIEVDNPAYSDTAWQYVDSTISFSTACPAVGVEETLAATARLVPNPASAWVSLESTLPVDGYVLHNLHGQQVLCGSYTGQRIDVSGLPAGLYWLTATASGAKQFTRQLVVE